VGRLLPSSLCAQLLADLGAEVIKVEEPGVGDYMRVLPLFQALARGKRSVTLNLRRAEGRRLLYMLAARSHVLVESFRPKAARRLGLGPSKLRRVNRRLIYCSITGYGKKGEHAPLPSHDINCAGLAGLLPGEGYEPLLPLLIADIAAGLAAALYICAALASRSRGLYIDVSMADAALPFSLYRLTQALAGSREELLNGRYAYYRLYRSREGKPVSVAALEPEFQEALKEALGLSDEKPEALAEALASRELRELLRLARQRDLPLQEVLEPEQLPGHAYYRRRGSLSVRQGVPYFSLALLDGRPQVNEGRPCALGEHTEQVLLELGVRREELAALRRRGVI